MARDLVIGLGNPIMGDDGIGLAALERLREGWEIPPRSNWWTAARGA